MKAIDASRLDPTDQALAALAAQAPNAELRDSDEECVIEAMDPRKGHLTLKWGKGDEDEIDAARAIFEDLVGTKGYLAFALEKGGTKGEQVTTFDPRVKGYLLSPALQGG